MNASFEGREQRLEDRANIPPLYQSASLDSFALPVDNPTARTGLATVVLNVRSYIREFPNLAKPGLLFLGPPERARRIWQRRLYAG